MNYSEYIPLVGAICNFLLALFVLIRGAKVAVNLVYACLGTSIAIWNLGTFFMFRVHIFHDSAGGLFWARFIQFGVIFLPPLFMHLSLLVSRPPGVNPQANRSYVYIRRFIMVLYVLSGLLALSNFTPFFVRGIRDLGYAYYAEAGPGFWIFSIPYSCVMFSVYILTKRRRQLPKIHRRRLTPLIVAQATLSLLGTNDIMPILDIDHYPFLGYRIYPLGSFAAIFYGVAVGYSVLQQQLLDVRMALGRIAAHTLRLVFLLLVGLILMLIASTISPQVFQPVTVATSLAVLLVSAISASIFFPRLFGSGEDIIERSILGDRFEYHDKVKGFINAMPLYNDNNLLLDDLHELLVKTVDVANYQIILLDETNRAFTVFRSYPEEQPGPLPELTTDSPIFRYFEKTEAEYAAANPTYSSIDSGPLHAGACEQMAAFKSEFCFPLAADQSAFGLLLIGPKAVGEPYTATDVKLLAALGKNLSLMVNQIRLQNQILLAQELDLLGRMSRGMAHDLNNLLTPIWTLLQLVNEDASVESLKEELLPVALRNVKTMRAYIRESLFFSRNLRPDIQLGRLDLVIGQAVEMVQDQMRRKEIQAVVESAPDVLVEMDEVLIQRLIANLISNAVDASPAQTSIRVQVKRLAKTEVSRDWLRVTVKDQGEGIKDENLNRIFTPYFTTKDRGDENRGFGLGLAICRKIVHLHGGNLRVTSQVNKGTTVTVDLPSHQSAPAAKTHDLPVNT